ncbi:ABC transporter permease subunit, partial [bacterium]|nr:ABC transporter permease subunit [candidate division CSSED10-310 bacterium]
FWLGPMLILIFCLQLDWLPTPIYGPEGVTSFILPAITLGTALAAILTRMIRSSLLDVIRSPYIMTAYAKGASHCRAILRHALRNALIPVVTILGLQFGALLGGSIITETIFSWPGIGKELIDAITARDYPVIQGCVLLIAFSYVLVNLLTDLTYGYLDPRIQLNTRSKHGILAAGKLQAKWMILAGIIVMLFFTGVFIEFFTRYGVLTLLISLVTLTGKAFFHLITFLSSRFFQVLLLLTIPVFIIRWRKNNEQSWRRFARNHFAVAGLCITVLFLITGIIGPSIAPYDALKQDLQNQQQSPTWQHPFGTDDAGRDLFSRVLDGSKVSVKVGVTVTIFSVLVGTLIGILSGMFGGWIDECVMRFVDILLAFPGILLAIAMMAIFREKFSGQELTLLIMALCVMGWVGYARLARAQILSLKESDFVAAARALGVSNRRLILQHFVPNIAAPIIVQATLGMAGVIIAEAGLSFLGLGIGPPHPSWGNILNTGTDVMMLSGYPYMAIFPGIFIMITVMGLNFLGDGIRDALDPQSQPRK